MIRIFFELNPYGIFLNFEKKENIEIMNIFTGKRKKLEVPKQIFMHHLTAPLTVWMQLSSYEARSKIEQ